jgi:hypothetical protein
VSERVGGSAGLFCIRQWMDEGFPGNSISAEFVCIGDLASAYHRMTAMERAFQLAKSGEVSGLTEIVKALRREGYSANQIEGPALKRQLTNLIKAARA